MAFPELDFVASLGGGPPEAPSPKAGLWEIAAGGVLACERPHFPTSVRIVALGPARATRKGQGPQLYEATIEVETEPLQIGSAPVPHTPATHYVLTASVVNVADGEMDQRKVKGFRHHCKSIVPFARCTSFAVTGLSAGTFYEFDVCTANASSSSEGVQVHVLTPSPSMSRQASPSARVRESSPEEASCEEEDYFDAESLVSACEGEEPQERSFEDCDEEPALRPPPGAGREPRELPEAQRLVCQARAGDPGHPKLFPGLVWAAGFQINERQLSQGTAAADVEQAVKALEAACQSPSAIRPQQALRLALGMALDIEAAEAKWDQISMWRSEFKMEEERQRTVELHEDRDRPVSFPYHEEVCEKLLTVSPCVLVTTTGSPITIWHIGTLKADANVPVEHVDAWSRSFFEYLDVWLSKESDRTSRLLGHIHIFDLQGLSWWHLMSGELLERGRSAMHAGEFYPENCYDIYAINASTIFNTVWRLLQRFLSARAAGKVVVDSGVPNELLAALGPMAWERLQNALQLGKARLPILRPPKHGGRQALL